MQQIRDQVVDMTATTTVRDTVRNGLISALGECKTPEEVADALAILDDYALELDSKEAEYAIVYVEGVLGVDLPAPADLGREQFATLGNLIDAIMSNLPEGR